MADGTACVVVSGLPASGKSILARAVATKLGRPYLDKDVAYGDGGKPELTPVVRAQANFSEYVPLTLLLIGYLQFTRASANPVHGLGATLVGARLLHPVGLGQPGGPHVLRVLGTVTAILVPPVAAIAAITDYLSAG